ncbi:regulator of CtrA degradation [Sphingomonas vulcanisoli]|uniref:Regulator of CtrA degradation n=1 Tax=Sphingomonas vulcanisoli TaxID=1658060 RepID=A0ABX0TUL0_9SPHN|nr:DUF1465 family protein [Sphingomonas vulcanisoli]NIJ08082.1 regulator of CtrA degradation [Sphingomonas vulcanisoli]
MRADAIASRLIEGLYSEALLLADETRAYFDQGNASEREGLTPAERVLFACEALKASTRLMQVIGWLLMRKAEAAGEVPVTDPSDPGRRLEEVPAIDADALARFPARGRQLVLAGFDLHQRVARIDQGDAAQEPSQSPARALLHRLERSI